MERKSSSSRRALINPGPVQDATPPIGCVEVPKKPYYLEVTHSDSLTWWYKFVMQGEHDLAGRVVQRPALARFG